MNTNRKLAAKAARTLMHFDGHGQVEACASVGRTILADNNRPLEARTAQLKSVYADYKEALNGCIHDLNVVWGCHDDLDFSEAERGFEVCAYLTEVDNVLYELNEIPFADFGREDVLSRIEKDMEHIDHEVADAMFVFENEWDEWDE